MALLFKIKFKASILDDSSHNVMYQKNFNFTIVQQFNIMVEKWMEDFNHYQPHKAKEEAVVSE